MRTTVTLTDQATSLIRASMNRHGYTFKQAVNQAIVSGLGRKDSPSFETPTFDSGTPRVSLVKANALAEAMEDAALVKKIGLGT